MPALKWCNQEVTSFQILSTKGGRGGIETADILLDFLGFDIPKYPLHRKTYGSSKCYVPAFQNSPSKHDVFQVERWDESNFVINHFDPFFDVLSISRAILIIDIILS